MQQHQLNYVGLTEQAFKLYVKLEKLFLHSFAQNNPELTERLEIMTAAARGRMIRRKALVWRNCSANDFHYISSLWHKYGD